MMPPAGQRGEDVSREIQLVPGDRGPTGRPGLTGEQGPPGAVGIAGVPGESRVSFEVLLVWYGHWVTLVLVLVLVLQLQV